MLHCAGQGTRCYHSFRQSMRFNKSPRANLLADGQEATFPLPRETPLMLLYRDKDRLTLHGEKYYQQPENSQRQHLALLSKPLSNKRHNWHYCRRSLFNSLAGISDRPDERGWTGVLRDTRAIGLVVIKKRTHPPIRGGYRIQTEGTNARGIRRVETESRPRLNTGTCADRLRDRRRGVSKPTHARQRARTCSRVCEPCL